MLTYTFSRREKALLLIFAILLLAIVWFVFVYQRTTNEITRLDSEISATQIQVSADRERVDQLDMMRNVIEQRKAEGAEPTVMPDYDNMRALMTELNGIMRSTQTYSLSFDEVVHEEGADHVDRGVRIDYTVASYRNAESIVKALAGGTYPCRIDSVSINDEAARSVTRTNVLGETVTETETRTNASVHVTFFERYSEAAAAVFGSQENE